MELNKSLKDVEKILSEYKTLKDYIDKTGEIFVLASTIFSLLIAPNPLSAIAIFGTGATILSFRFSKLFNWLPDKLNYWNKGKEEIVIQRYEKAILANMIIFHIAIREGIKKILPEHIETYQKSLTKILSLKNGEIDEEKLKEYKTKMTEIGEKIDEKIRNLSLDFHRNYKDSLSIYIRVLLTPVITEMVNIIDHKEKEELKSRIINQLEEEIYLNYNAFLVHLCTEFPEFEKWVDLNQYEKIIENQRKVINQLKKYGTNSEEIKKFQKEFNCNLISSQKEFLEKLDIVFNQLKKINDYSFDNSFGFEKILEQQFFFNRKLDKIQEILKEDKLIHIKAHHNQIKHKLKDRLVDNEDIEGIVYPKNEDIFIPQSFSSITYQNTKHQKKILLEEFWIENEDIINGENVGKFIVKELYSPINTFNPIIILGNPGAGKSMLSSLLGARLCDSNDFVPFFIRLRDVVLVDTNPKNHINEGIKNSIEGNPDVDWTNWAREFKDRIPVIILDGFDELLRASRAEISNYILKIKELQENVYRNYEISARIILTSRLTVMQDVDIPNETTIIRLNSFDEKRQNQWISKWNNLQFSQKFKDFILPNNISVKELAKEPLLLFMLAVYDFENSELQEDANRQSFNQSKLYDKLFNKFTHRQLDKDPQYSTLGEPKKDKLSKIFRLRLGAISTLMFLNNVDYKDTNKLSEELDSFGVGGEEAQPNLIFKGFFFIHKDKSTEVTGLHSYTFEFIHKSFGEFLTADFLLRVILEKFESEDEIEKLQGNECLKFAWGYNWLNKHYNTVRFLFEHIDVFVTDEAIKPQIIKIIKNELKDIFSTNIRSFPVTEINLIKGKPILEHLAIYSQNLILLWTALEKNNKFALKLYSTDISTNCEFKFSNQDRNEINENKQFWKRTTKLWELYGNKETVAKLKEWVSIEESGDDIILNFKNNEITHNYSDSAQISCNDYELLLSFGDNNLSIYKLRDVIARKPELIKTGVNIINNKYDIFFIEDEILLEELSSELIHNTNLSITERARLKENILEYFPYRDFNFRVSNEKDIDDNWGEMLKYSTGKNLSSNHVFYNYSYNRTMNEFTQFMFDNHTKMGINRFLNFIEFNIHYFHRFESEYLIELFENKIDDFLKNGNNHQLKKFFEYIKKFLINISLRKELDIKICNSIKHVYQKTFSRIKKSDNLITYEYLNSFIISKVYLSRIHPIKNKEIINDILPNSIIEDLFYNSKYSNDIINRNDNINLLLNHLELFIIAIKNKYININLNVEYADALIKNGSNILTEKDYYSHESYIKLFDLLIMLFNICNRKGGKNTNKFNEQINFLVKTDILNFASYPDKLKILNILINHRSIISNDNLSTYINNFYLDTNRLKKINSRMRLQFLLLINEIKEQHIDSLKYLETQLNNKKTELNNLRRYKSEFLYEFNNNYYYETNNISHIPNHFLRRSILHRENEWNRRKFGYYM